MQAPRLRLKAEGAYYHWVGEAHFHRCRLGEVVLLIFRWRKAVAEPLRIGQLKRAAVGRPKNGRP